MKIRLPYISLLVFLMWGSSVFSQHVNLGLTSGVAYYLGEINPAVPIINQPNPAVGIFYQKNMNKRYALRYGLNYAKLSAAEDFRSAALAAYRQLSFSSDLWEVYSTLEFNFIPYQIDNKSTKPFTPYVFIGIAVFRVNPTATGKDSFSNTEGGLTSASIPFGVGFKFDFIENLGLGIEWGVRKTYTDLIDGLPKNYLDGYQLSNAQNNDWYGILGITLNYKILTHKDKCNMPRF